MRKHYFYIIGLMLAAPVTVMQAVSPVFNRVFDYVPAPGQFINQIPEWTEGDDAAVMADKAYEMIVTDEGMISLGAFGGYVTLGFEKTIVNVDGERDIYIEGNAFQSGSSSTQGGSSEPGVVLVAYDINGNGRPDDNEWFEIAGSEYDRSEKDYEITYMRPVSDDSDIRWTDNLGNTGTVDRNTFHTQSYWPQWINEDELTFRGTRLPDNGVNEGTADEPYFVLSRYDFGYADNYPNTDSDGNWNEGAKIDIDWAIDRNGNTVKMPGVDFVRIYTGVNQSNGWIGECSTEVCRVMNAHVVRSGSTDVVDESVTVDQAVLDAFLKAYPQGNASVGIVTDNSNVRIYVDNAGCVRFTLNEPAMVYVYNQNGQLVAQRRAGTGENSLSLSDCPSGLYIVVVGGVTQKILKR